ncbi:hypothetical protein C8R45DRAFT_1103957 [Mycena sanguinolenta]|nr:hypothetical protein C8R45DRAFT_1103957 [Mycena sanguinolenta]
MSTLNARHQLNSAMDRPSLSSSGRHANVVLARGHAAAIDGDSKNIDSTDDAINDEHRYRGIRMTKVVERV